MLRDIEGVERTNHDVPLATRLTIGSLHRLPEEFHLMGSRFFRCAKDTSDWDFAVQYTPDVVQKLKNLGFASLGYLSEYNDGHTVDVLECCNVQVQLRGNLPLTLIVRDILSANFWDEHLRASGEKRRAVWENLHAAIGLLMEDAPAPV